MQTLYHLKGDYMDILMIAELLPVTHHIRYVPSVLALRDIVPLDRNVVYAGNVICHNSILRVSPKNILKVRYRDENTKG